MRKKLKKPEPIGRIASRVIRDLIEKIIKPLELNQTKNDTSPNGTNLTSISNKEKKWRTL